MSHYALSVSQTTVITSEKKWRTHKTPSWFANTWIYSLLHLLVVVEKREIEYGKKRVPCFRQREINRRKKREGGEREREFDITFLVFFCSSRMCLLRVLSSPLCIRAPTLPFSSFQSHFQFSPTAFPLELLSANRSQQAISCWYISVFNLGVRNNWLHLDLEIIRSS